jgi:N-carbamoyl-L-amino-acid hydrolase
MSPLTLHTLNAAGREDFARLLQGIYEHSPWVAESAERPAGGFVSLAGLQHALVQAVRNAPREQQLALVRAHPELAGKAMVAGTLTAESTGEQSRAGLTHCTPGEFERLQQLNADYNLRFGWPFILAVRGPRATGLSRAEIIATFARRLQQPAELEFAESLRQIHRIAQIRLNERFGFTPVLGEQVWDWAQALAVHSDPPWCERGELTVTYLTPAHRACALQIEVWMRECGFDEVSHDALGNVVGVYHGSEPAAPRLLTGSHYDTVRNAGRHDGRLGIFAPMAAVQALHRAGRRLRHGLEVVAFAEEEGQRWKATFLASGALVGAFDPAWLDQADADGVTLREAMHATGLPGTMPAIEALRRDPSRYLGFVELHIEQGPVLNTRDLPLGVVTSINGSRRLLGSFTGLASHAGTTPMGQRRDAAAAAAELVLALEARAAAVPDVVGTVGLLEVPGGSINVVPGQCRFSLDIRATTDAARDACVDDVLAQARTIAGRRGVALALEETMAAAAAPCHPEWQARWAAAVQALGLPVFHLPSGAGHDAMVLHRALPQAMLFVRGLNAGISHNPLEEVTADDADLAVRAFLHLMESL